MLRRAVQIPLLLALLLTACPRSRSGPDSGKERQVQRELKSLPYLNWVPVRPEDRTRQGVTRHDRTRARAGVNLYNSAPRATALLIDMEGKELHRWSSEVGQPGAEARAWHKMWSHLDFIGWQQVKLGQDGALFAIVNFHMLLKLDRRSRLVWQAEISAHHDLDIAESGEIYVLTAEKRAIRHGAQTLRVLDSAVTVLSPAGKPLRRISLLDVLRRSPKTTRLVQEKLRWAAPRFRDNFAQEALVVRALQNERNARKTIDAVQAILADRFEGSRRVELMLMNEVPPMDLLHANSVEILRRDVKHLGRRGDLLLSVRDLDLVLVLDPRTSRVGWTFGPGQLERQHHPSLLDNGNVLIFDNRPTGRGSRVVEVNPRGRAIVWSYPREPAKGFHSMVRGGCQRLPGGNTLITDSERGRVLEVTPQGKVVWEFFNPDLDDPFLRRKRAPIYRMIRFPPGAVPTAGHKPADPPEKTGPP